MIVVDTNVIAYLLIKGYRTGEAQALRRLCAPARGATGYRRLTLACRDTWVVAVDRGSRIAVSRIEESRVPSDRVPQPASI